MHVVERPVEVIVCRLGRGRETQCTDALERARPVCKRDGKELSDTVRNRCSNRGLESTEGACSPNLTVRS